MPSLSSRPDNRVQIANVWPQLDGGRTPVKRVIGDVVQVWADIFCDGHDVIAADLLFRSAVDADWRRTPMRFHDNDRWRGEFTVTTPGRYVFRIEAWRDPFASWRKDISAKRQAGQKLDLEIREGLQIVQCAVPKARGADRKMMASLIKPVLDEPDPERQLVMLLGEDFHRSIQKCAPRQNVSRFEPALDISVDRQRARFSAWYELFPRSMGADGRHGTFDDVIAHLPYVRDLGFDVLYFPPIHPIGRTNRKGRNNQLGAQPDDVGSVYAIGSEDGGHDAIHPQLGGLQDFDRLVQAARDHDLEIALDFAIQCSPDHPWIREYPDWFEWRPDGTLKHAENPPKKYEDIVNVNFYCADQMGLWRALRDVILFWIGHGVRIFRVDNPHTKPIPFWKWLIAEVNAAHPDVIFLAEAFTRPRMMEQLAKIGFQQSYTYFTWRNTKAELTAYAQELAGEMGEYYRPNFFANTPDINPFYLQTSGPAGFVIRATLAATLSSNWGIYSGFEFCESEPLLGREEYLDSEKYQLRRRDFDLPGPVRDHIRLLNRLRNQYDALQDWRNILFLNAGNDHILAYAKLAPAYVIFILVNLDPHQTQGCAFEIPLWHFGLPDHGQLAAIDLIHGHEFILRGKMHSISLDPREQPVMLWRLSPNLPNE